METSEETSLLRSNHRPASESGLSVFFAIVCIIDVFGVFPIVALPKVIIDCGFYGIIVVATVCSTQIYTAILLGKCWVIAEKIHPTIRLKTRYPYSALAELTYGKTLSKFVTVLLDVTVFGGGIPNLIVASQNFELLGLRLSDDSFDVSYCSWIVILGAILCPILWLGSPKDMKLLCTISVGIVFGVFLLIFGCIVASPAIATATAPQNADEFSRNRPLWRSLVSAYGIIAFQFDIHPTILTIQVDMRDKDRLTRAVFGGFALTLGMFATVTICAAIKFGGATQPSVLTTLAASAPLHAAAALVALQLCLTSAISNSALYQHVEDCMEIARSFNHRRCLLRTILTILAIVIAESVPRFDLVMSLIGGALTGPLVFILPPLFYLKMTQLQERFESRLNVERYSAVVGSSARVTGRLEGDGFKKGEFGGANGLLLKILNAKGVFEGFLCVSIVVLSVFVTVFTTYLNVVNVVRFSGFSQPCIYNVSSAVINF